MDKKEVIIRIDKDHTFWEKLEKIKKTIGEKTNSKSFIKLIDITYSRLFKEK